MSSDLEQLADWIEDLPEGATFAFDVSADADVPEARDALERGWSLVQSGVLARGAAEG